MKRGRKSKYCDNTTSNNKWNVALYIRLSVQDGDKAESNSVVNQKELLDMFIGKEYNDYTKEHGEQIRQSEDTIDKYYEGLKEFDQACRESSWIKYFTKYKNVNSLSKGLIDSLVDNIYIYEDKKIKIKFKYEDEYNYLMDFIKRRKNFLS